MHLLAPALAFATLVFAACGSDTDNASPPDQGTPCEATQAKICKRACECGGGVGCTFRDPGLATVTFPSEESCNQALVGSACGDGYEEIDYALCQNVVGKLECAADDGGTMAIERPPLCKPAPVSTTGSGGAGGGG